MKRYVLCYIFLTFILANPLFSQNNQIESTQNDGVPQPDLEPELRTADISISKYASGDASLSLGLGLFVPLFNQTFEGDYITDTRITPGGAIFLEFDIFLWRALSAGMEISGMFAFTPNERVLFMGPITAHLKYTFQFYPVEVPVSLGLGLSLDSLGELFKTDFAMKPKIAVTYRIDPNWIAGVYYSYWFIVQSYNNNPDIPNEDSRMGNFSDVSLGFTYVFN